VQNRSTGPVRAATARAHRAAHGTSAHDKGEARAMLGRRWGQGWVTSERGGSEAVGRLGGTTPSTRPPGVRRRVGIQSGVVCSQQEEDNDKYKTEFD
jgi:hypothetical protein